MHTCYDVMVIFANPSMLWHGLLCGQQDVNKIYMIMRKHFWCGKRFNILDVKEAPCLKNKNCTNSTLLCFNIYDLGQTMLGHHMLLTNVGSYLKYTKWRNHGIWKEQLYQQHIAFGIYDVGKTLLGHHGLLTNVGSYLKYTMWRNHGNWKSSCCTNNTSHLEFTM